MSKRRLPVAALASAAGLASLIAVPLASAGGMYDVSTCRATVGSSHYSGADAAQAGVDAAEALSANATVKISGSCGPVVIDDAVTPHTITLRGAGRNPTLDGQGNPGSVVTVQAESTAVIRGLKITRGTGALSAITGGGDVGSGGGIHNDGTLTVRNSRVTANTATGGGGGIFSTGPLTVIDSRIDANSVSGIGGGIAAHATLTVRGSRFAGNIGYAGGGIAITASAPGVLASVSDSQVQTNVALGGGGGIVNSGAILTITRSQVSHNAVPPSISGGGIYNCLGGSLTLTRSQVNRNTAGRGGGIINASVGSTVALVESEVSHNMATDIGGGILNAFAPEDADTTTTVSISRKSKVQRNTSGGDGGGIWTGYAGTILENGTTNLYSGTGVNHNTAAGVFSADPASEVNIFGNFK